MKHWYLQNSFWKEKIMYSTTWYKLVNYIVSNCAEGFLMTKKTLN